MDKYEYNLKLDQMKSLSAEENYDAAAEIADSINWNKIKNVNALFRAGEIYEMVGRFQDAKEVFLLAYDRSPIGRMIIYRLAEVAIKMNDFDAAREYYEEFVEIAPHDNLKYVLKYNLRKAQGAEYIDLIPILENLKEQEYTEEWAYELAYLYHKAGLSDKCIEACDELILWFGDGPYVERALELKMLYQPLTKLQEEKYRLFRKQQAGITDISAYEMERAGEYVHEAVSIPPVSTNTEKFNTVNLQEEIARGMQQIMDATEKETVSDTMDSIKKMVEEIPYLTMPLPKDETEEMIEEKHIETDEEIDGSLKINFQELIGEEYDGQMSLMMEERRAVEKQITGQMSIEDVLEEWEKTRHAAEVALQEAEQRKLESAKARALQEAGDIMDRLTDVIPRLDAGITPKELLEEQYMQNILLEPENDPLINLKEMGDNLRELEAPTEEQASKIFTDMNTLLGREISRLNDENAYIDEALAKAAETAVELAPEVLEATHVALQPEEEIQDIAQSIVETAVEDIAQSVVETAAEDVTQNVKDQIIDDKNAYAVETMVDAAMESQMTEKKEKEEELSLTKEIEAAVLEQLLAAGYKMAEEEASEEAVEDISDKIIADVELETAQEVQSVQGEQEVQKTQSVQGVQEVQEVQEVQSAQGEQEVQVTQSDEIDKLEVGETDIDTEKNVQTKDEIVIETPEIDKTVTRRMPDLEDVQRKMFMDMKTREIPEVTLLEDDEEEEADAIVKNEQFTPTITSLSPDLRGIFSYFVPVKGMEEQLCQMLTGVTKRLNENATSKTGNIIVQGGRACGKTVLATSIIKALQKETGKPNGRIGKIGADALNHKDIRQMMQKVAGGCMIIEQAGSLTRETAVTLSLLLEHDTSGVLIILEDTTMGIKKALSLDDGFAKKFSEKITVPTFTNDELVAFAKAYSKEKGYAIDEMAILALYNRISKIQKIDQATTLTEVKEIVDSAIENEKKGGFKKTFSNLWTKRYTEDERIILYEKDFE